MTTVLKHAVEAVEARAAEAKGAYEGEITVTLRDGGRDAGDAITVTIEDNGIGLPANPERLTQPYVTTREKGTGLGLAIVNKIVDEHGGDMSFASSPGGGTRVSLSFARNPNPIEGGGA